MAAVVRMHTGKDGKTHLEEVKNAFTRSGTPEVLQPAKGVTFRHAPGGGVADWHPAPRRQYVIVLSGEMEIEAGDGARRKLGPGDVLLAEDTTGQGHITHRKGDWRTAIIPLA